MAQRRGSMESIYTISDDDNDEVFALEGKKQYICFRHFRPNHNCLSNLYRNVNRYCHETKCIVHLR